MTSGTSLPDSPAFLAAIAANPADDLPRLVYADYLDENGDPERAEFIRVQIELAKLPAHDPRRAGLTARERELVVAHRSEWRLPQFPDQHQVFHRGFVDRIESTGEWLIAHPNSLLAAPMVNGLKIVNAASAGMRLTELPGLEQIEHLDLTNTHQGVLFEIPEFLTTARLTRLRHLTLGTCGFWEWAMPALVAVERLRQLDRLDLWGNPFGDNGVATLAASPNVTNLRSLDLSAHEQQYIHCIHANGAEELAASAYLVHLRDLNLNGHHIGDAGLQSLVNSPNTRHLERLTVAYNDIGEIGDSGVEAVVESQHLGNLRELVLAKNRLSPLGAETLAAWPHLERMRFVDLRECEYGEFGEVVRERLMRSPWAEKFIL